MTKKNNVSKLQSLALNDRFWILIFSLFVSIACLVWVWVLVPTGSLQTIRLQQTYGFIGLIYLYFALLATPLCKIFTRFRYRERYLHARRAIGVSAFYFSLLHFLVAFFGQLGGIGGLQFLSDRYGIALLLGFVALLILMAMALTSFDKVIDRMGFPRWKRLHRFIYIGGLAVLLHIIMLGSHYAYGSSIVARLTFIAVLLLFLLEAVRIDRWLKARFAFLRHFGVTSMAILHVVFLGAGFALGRSNASFLDLRATHSSHGSSGGHPTEAYVEFDATTLIDGKTIRINEKSISFEALIAGGAVVSFDVNSTFSDIQKTSCFVINQETYMYSQGLSKVVGNQIQCLPIGDVNPPQPGFYTLYLRIERTNAINTIPFNLEIKP